MLHILSTLVLALIAAGLYFRKKSKKIHLTFMSSAFAVDLSLVLYIELTRKAVETVIGGVPPLLLFHAGVSTAVLAVYIAMIILGRKMLKGVEVPRLTHRNLAIAFCVLRLTNYVTSYVV